MNKSLLIASLILLIMSNSYAQINRYAIFFTNKGGNENPYSLEEPTAFLSERAVERRTKQGIVIDSTDMPVYPPYVEEIQALGIDVFFTSRWLNAAIIQTDETNIADLDQLAFVDSITLIADASKLTYDHTEYEVAEVFSAPRSVAANTEYQLDMLQVDLMHEEGIKGEGMLIAILDDGFEAVNEYEPFEHLWENDQVVATMNFVENDTNVFKLGDHGTSVLSTIAAKYEDDFYGVAYNADFILCITEEGGSEDRVEEFNLVLGAEYADSLGADIINASLGYRLFDIDEHNYGYEDMDGETAVSSIAFGMAADKGMIVVASSGNSGDGSYKYVSVPADAKGILTVGSVNAGFSKSSFSSVGPTSDGRLKPDVSALGLSTTVVTGTGRITTANGTSFSSPLIAGFAAGIWQANPDWTSQEVISAIKNGSHKVHNPDTLVGYGVPFYTYAVEGNVVLNVTDILEDKIVFYPNPFRGDKLYLRASSPLEGKWQLNILNGDGKAILNSSFKARRAEKVMEFNLAGIEEGIYYLILQSENTQKVVKLLNF